MPALDPTTHSGRDAFPAGLIWGGYGWGNTGDELNLAIAIHDMAAKFGPSLAVLSPQPQYTRWLFPDVRVIHYQPHLSIGKRVLAMAQRQGWLPKLHSRTYRAPRRLEQEGAPPWVQALRRCQRLHLAGGGYLNDLFDVDYYLLPIHIARLAHTRITSAPLGLGPFLHSKPLKRTVQALQGVRVAVRDVKSLELCQAQGILATLLQDDGFRARRCFPELFTSREHTGDKALKVGLCAYVQHGDLHPERTHAWWLEVVKLLKVHAQAEMEGFCFHADLGLDFSMLVEVFTEAGVAQRKVIPPCWDFRQAIRRLGRYDAIISSRFHAVVLAKLLRLPHVAVAAGDYYGAKMAALEATSPWTTVALDPHRDAPQRALECLLNRRA